MIYDITRPLERDMAVYSGHERFSIEELKSVAADGYRLSRISMGAHCGTHMDAPAHFVPGGATIDEVPLELLTGRVRIVTLGEDGTLPKSYERTERLLVRDLRGGLTYEQALSVIKLGVRLIGTTSISIAPADDEERVHRAFLENGVWILENLCLDYVADGRYEITCLPLKIAGAEGAPARAVLFG